MLTAKGGLYSRGSPYFAASTMLRELFGIDRSASPTTAGRLVAAQVVEVAPELEPWLPLLAIAFGAETPMTPEVERIDPGQPGHQAPRGRDRPPERQAHRPGRLQGRRRPPPRRGHRRPLRRHRTTHRDQTVVAHRAAVAGPHDVRRASRPGGHDRGRPTGPDRVRGTRPRRCRCRRALRRRQPRRPPRPRHHQSAVPPRTRTHRHHPRAPPHPTRSKRSSQPGSTPSAPPTDCSSERRPSSVRSSTSSAGRRDRIERPPPAVTVDLTVGLHDPERRRHAALPGGPLPRGRLQRAVVPATT